MELQEFIKESLVQIVRGVEGAVEALEDTTAIISPSRYHCTEHHAFKYEQQENRKYRRSVQLVDFDVAVSASEGKETKGGIGVVVASFTLGTTGKSDATSGTVSRIKFRVPIVLPDGEGRS